MKHSAIQQYDYHKWANNRVFNHLNELPDGVFSQEIKSVFSSVKEVLAHVYLVDGMWLSVMSGDSFSETTNVISQLKENSKNPSLSEIQSLFEKVNHQYENFLNNQENLDEVISIEHPRYGKMDVPVSELVKHVVNHGTYHRGNITAMLRQQGHAGVPTDYIFYLYEGTEIV